MPSSERSSIRVPDENFFELLKKDEVDFLTFASPSAVRGFFVRVKDGKLQRKARDITTIAVGPRVERTLKKYGFKDVRTATEPTVKAVS